jgi:hypothetical protein
MVKALLFRSRLWLQGMVPNVTNTITGGIYRGSAQARWQVEPIDSKVPPTVSSSSASVKLVTLGNGSVRLLIANMTFAHSMSYNRAPRAYNLGRAMYHDPAACTLVS